MKFAAMFSALRRENGLSQRKVAGDLNISQALLSHYEKGIREPRLEFVERACAYYGVTADYMLGMGGIRENPLPLRGPEDEELWGSRSMRQQLAAVDLLLRSAMTAAGPEGGRAVQRGIAASLALLPQTMAAALGEEMPLSDRLFLERQRMEAETALTHEISFGAPIAPEEKQLLKGTYQELLNRLRETEDAREA